MSDTSTDSDPGPMDALYKSCAASILNSIKDLSHASEEQRKRWPWELIQNACDSISGDPSRHNDVKVTIHCHEDKVVFIHNGSPFTDDQFNALIYKYSEGKENKPDTTGQFGTGFCSTHVLSRTVEIETNIKFPNNTIKRRSAVMHREGNERDELKQGIKDTQKSIQTFNSNDKKETIFTYEIPKENIFNRESAGLGIQEFKKNIIKVLIFCPKLKRAKLIIDDDVTWTDLRESISFSRATSLEDKDELKEIIITEKNAKTKELIREHVYVVSRKSDKYKEDGFEPFEFKVTGAIEVDEKQRKIIVEESSKRNMVYITFPVLGFESFDFPIYINSNELNPFTERNGIHLKEEKFRMGPCTYGLSNYGENQQIFKTCVSIFNEIVGYCSEKKMVNIYCLLRGLNPPKIFDNNLFDDDSYKWFNEEIINKFRLIILSHPVLQINNDFHPITKGSLISYDDVVNANNDDEKNKEQQQKYYDIIVESQVFASIPSFEISLCWYNAFWDKKYFIKLDDFCTKVSERKANNNIHFMNKLIDYLYKNHQEKLRSIPLIPVLSGDYVKLDENLCGCKSIPKCATEIMKSIKSPWNSRHIKHEIISIKLHEDELSQLIAEISDVIRKKPKEAFNVLQFIPNGKECNIQEILFIYANKLKPSGHTMVRVEGLEYRLWDEVNKTAVNEMLEIISEKEMLEEVPFNLNEFIRFIKSINFSELIKDYKVIPNVKGKLMESSELYDSCDVEDPIIEAYSLLLNGEDFFDSIKMKSFDSVRCNDPLKIDFFIEQFNNNHSKDLAESLIRVLPPKGVPSYDRQRSIYHMYCLVFGKDEKPVEIKCADERIWTKANEMIIAEIITKVNSCKTIKDVMKLNRNEKDKEKAIELLNKCYDFTKDKTLKVPNRKGDLCNVEDVKICKAIDNNLIDLYETISENDISGDLLENGIKNDYVKDYDQYSFMKMVTDCISKVIDNKNGNSKNKEKIDKLGKLIFKDIGNIFDKKEEGLYGEIKDDCMHKMYANAISNALHEVDSCKEETKKRWPWELTQNACDSISGSPQDKRVYVEIKAHNDSIEFIHDGSPFTQEQIVALMYMYSEGKGSNKDTTGQFGTGFTSTHVLSRNVEITANIVGRNNVLKRRFITLYRDGNGKDDLIAGIVKTEKEIADVSLSGSPDDNKTIFKYKFNDNSECRKAADLGIHEFIENMPRVMIFCPRLDHATLYIDNSTNWTELRGTFDFQREKSTPISSSPLMIYNISEKNEKGVKLHQFIGKTISEKTVRGTKYEVTGAIEVNTTTNSIIESKNSVFLTFPLLGFESFEFPIIINSKNFTSTVERTSILLKGPDTKGRGFGSPDSNQGLNKRIIEATIQIYDEISSYCCSMKYTNMYNFLKGIMKNSFIDNCDSELVEQWFADKVQSEMKRILFNKEIVRTNHGFKKLYFPTFYFYSSSFDLTTNDAILFKDISAKENMKYEQIVSAFVKTHVIPEDSKNWAKILNDYVLTPEKLTKEIEKEKNVTEIKIYNSVPAVKALDMLLDYLKEKSNNKDYAIVPSESGLLKKSSDLSVCKINAEFYEAIKNFGINIDNSIIHHEITSITLKKEYTYLSAQNSVLRAFERLNDDNDEAVKTAQNVSKFIVRLRYCIDEDANVKGRLTQTTQLAMLKMFNIIEKSNIEQEESDFNLKNVFRYAYKYMIRYINSKLKELKTIKDACQQLEISEEAMISALNNYYSCFEEEIENQIYEEQKLVYPNINGEFIDEKDLYVYKEKNKRKEMENDDDFMKLSKLFYGGNGWNNKIVHMKIETKKVRVRSFNDFCRELEEDLLKRWDEKKKSEIDEDTVKIFSRLLDILKKREMEKLKDDAGTQKNDSKGKLLDNFSKISKKFSEISAVISRDASFEHLLSTENVNLADENAKLKQQNDEGKSKEQELKKKLDDAKQENDQSKQKIDSLNQQLDAVKQENVRLNQQIDSLRQQLNRLHGQNSSHPRVQLQTSHQQRSYVVQQLIQPRTNYVLFASVFVYEYLRPIKAFSSIEVLNITEYNNGTRPFSLNGKTYYEKNNDKPYDIVAELPSGFKFFIIVRATEVPTNKDGELPIDLAMLNDVPMENEDDESSETSLAIVWDAQNPTPDTCIFFKKSLLTKIIEEAKRH